MSLDRPSSIGRAAVSKTADPAGDAIPFLTDGEVTVRATSGYVVVNLRCDEPSDCVPGGVMSPDMARALALLLGSAASAAESVQQEDNPLAAMCKLCPTTEGEQGGPLTWVDWLEAGVCVECAHFFGIGESDAS